MDSKSKAPLGSSTHKATSVFKWLYGALPCFKVNSSQVVLLHTPQEFYEKLIEYSSSCTRRISLASLYIGTGEKEQRLVQTIYNRLEEFDNALEVTILMDGCRGRRTGSSSVELLLPLVGEFRNCQIGYYYAPDFTGQWKRYMPSRLNEIFGLQHMKVYVFDSNVIISGANLSEDYFTNRQDRYMIIKDCEPLARFYEGLIENIMCMCYQLRPNNSLMFPCTYYNPKDSPHLFAMQLKSFVLDYYTKFFLNGDDGAVDPTQETEGTWLFPLIELPPMSIHFDSLAIKRMMICAPAGSSVTLASGYFNLTKEYTSAIVHKSQAMYKFLFAHPSANGFFRARGLSGYVPSVYTVLAEQFLRNAHKFSAQNRISMFEFQREDWTYHAKGLWYTPPGQSVPDMTVIGSSNYGERSVFRDLETDLIVVTEDPELKARLEEEQRNLCKYSAPFTLDTVADAQRKSSAWLYYFADTFKSYF